MVTPEVSVRVATADGSELTFAPGVELTIGRDSGCAIVVADGRVSRTHATLAWDDNHETWVIRDAGSANGLFVDGVRGNEFRVTERLTVRLGEKVDDPQLVISAVRVPAFAAPVATVPNATSANLTAPNVTAPNPTSPTLAVVPPVVRAQRTVVGKSAEADFIVSDVLVSRRHARVTPTESGLLLEDLGSTNGTYLNGALITAGYVHEGDVITVGNTDLTIRDGAIAFLRQVSEKSGGLYVDNLEYALSSGKKLLNGVNLRSVPGTLTAVIGPSGAGKSTLAKVLAGVNKPSRGTVEFDGFDVHSSFELVRSRIGMVPQDDVLHTTLTVNRALTYAAKLRLRVDEDGHTRAAQVDRVIGQLDLDEHRRKRIDKLSGGQRKRASVALELLTEPALLILDEPTSGLDPALDRQVMQLLRSLATDERAVFVITHSVAYLDMCDDVLVLAPGGMPAYYGPPSGITAFFGTEDWADIFSGLADDPVGSWDNYRASAPPVAPPAERDRPAVRKPRRLSAPWLSQFITLCQRQVNLIFSDRVYLMFLLLLPIIVGLLVIVVPGKNGLGFANNEKPGEPSQLLAMLVIGACFMGASISIRDLIGERPIFLRERAVGLPVSVYLAAKLLVFSVLAIFMAAVLTFVTFLFKPPPVESIFFTSPEVGLFVALAMTTVASMTLGLLLSALVRSNEQVMPLLIVVLMAQLVLNGGLLNLVDTPVIYELSDLILAKWSFAMAASGVNLMGISPALKEDPLWAHTFANWFLAVACIISMMLIFVTITRIRLAGKYDR